MILILLLVTECIHSTQAVKPGRCPNNRNPDLECPSVVRPGECADDSSCPGNQKCCRFGCLPRCVDPEPDCPPVCLIFCPFGNVLDANGCPTCKCKPGPECPPVCDIYCEFGNVLDSNGCPTCRCKAAGNCPNGNALANIFCGRGPGRQDCPPGYSCNIDPLDRFAVCCPDTAGNCPNGNPLANIFCGRGPARQDCPPGYSCNIDPMDRFAVCCPDKKCPTEPVDYRCKFYRRSCDDDSSCTDGKKCCRQGCSYVCVNPFKM